MCGNLGLLLGEDCEFTAEDAAEAMTRVVAMRGAQSFGFWRATPSELRVHRAVLRKRADLASTLRAALAKTGACRGDQRPLVIGAHLRFATSSRSFAKEAHPHTWLGPVRTEINGTKATRIVLCTHNGDFEALDVGKLFGNDSQTMALDELRRWLSVRLGRPAPCAADSCALAGCLDLLFAAGDAAAAARLALARLDDARAGDAQMRGALVEGLKAGLDADALTKVFVDRSPATMAPLPSAEARRVAKDALAQFRGGDLRTAVVRFLRNAHGAFGVAAHASAAPGAVVLGSVKQPMIVGIGRGFVAYASERAALHVGCVGTRLEARYVLKEGDVLSIVAGSEGPRGCGALLQRATLADGRFATLEAFDGVSDLMGKAVCRSQFGGDVVGKDLAELPDVLHAITRSFDGGPNARTAQAFAARLFDAERRKSARLDLVIIGVECSLWVAEQWAVNLRAACPALRIAVASSNKALAALTACHNAITCNGATPSETVFPSGAKASASCHGALALAVSHSGQSFPTLHASRALKAAGADVFCVAGQLDVVIADDVIGQTYAPGSTISDRIFTTNAGIRLAEAASLTTAATHQLLTEVLLKIARAAPSEDVALSYDDLDDLAHLTHTSVERDLSILCSGTHDAASVGKAWGDHVVEPLVAFTAALVYILVTVTCGLPVAHAIAAACGLAQGSGWNHVILFGDALLYAFFTVVFSLFLRLMQGRTLLARFGKRTCLVLDVPMVHQCAVAFAQKLFGLAYGLNSCEFAGGNPGDHAVHKCLHRIVRGTLVAVGVPDGRLKALVDVECATYLSALQLKSLSNWGVGAELATVGHHSYTPDVVDRAVIFDFERPKFLSEIDHGLNMMEGTVEPVARRMMYLAAPVLSKVTSQARGDATHPQVRVKVVGAASHGDNRNVAGALASHAVVEALYEGRVASLERLVAFYVLFHAMAERVSGVSRFFFGLRFDTWRSQAGTRVATTPSPTSPAHAVDVALGLISDIPRVETAASFRDLGRKKRSSTWDGGMLDFSGRGDRTRRDVMDRSWRPMDSSRRSLVLDVSAYSSLGLDLSSSGYHHHPQRPAATSHLAALESVVLDGSHHTQDSKEEVP